MLSATLRPFCQEWKLCAEDCGLKCIQPAVHSLHHVLVPLERSMIRVHAHALRQLGVTHDDSTTVAVRAQVLAGEEAEGRRITERTNLLPIERREVRLRAVLDQHQATPA